MSKFGAFSFFQWPDSLGFTRIRSGSLGARALCPDKLHGRLAPPVPGAAMFKTPNLQSPESVTLKSKARVNDHHRSCLETRGPAARAPTPRLTQPAAKPATVALVMDDHRWRQPADFSIVHHGFSFVLGLSDLLIVILIRAFRCKARTAPIDLQIILSSCLIKPHSLPIATILFTSYRRGDDVKNSQQKSLHPRM